MSRTEARLVKKLQELRNVTSDHAVIHAAFAKGLEVELIAEGIRLYREGLTLEEAARTVGVSYGRLFDHSVVERVRLIEDPEFLEHAAELGRILGLPALTKAAENVLAENLQPA
jgi:hypothetical protein